MKSVLGMHSIIVKFIKRVSGNVRAAAVLSRGHHRSAYSAQLSSAQLSSAQALCQAIPVMTSSVWIDNIHMFHLDLEKFGNASKALMCWMSLASCRSPIRRISEVMLLVFVTSSLWFLVAYASPCKDLPPKVGAALLTPAAFKGLQHIDPARV